MQTCSKCGQQMEDHVLFCSMCGTAVEHEDICKEDAKSAVPAKESDDTPSDKKSAKERKIKDLKNQVVESGKKSVISIVVKQVVSCLISAILSAILVINVQNAFKDNIVDYKHMVESEFDPIASEILGHLLKYKSMNNADFIRYLEENRVMEKTTELLKKVKSYSSNDAEINTIHSYAIDCYEALHDYFILEYSYAIKYADPEDMVVDMQVAILKLESKLKIFEEVATEIYQKYGLTYEGLI